MDGYMVLGLDVETSQHIFNKLLAFRFQEKEILPTEEELLLKNRLAEFLGNVYFIGNRQLEKYIEEQYGEQTPPESDAEAKPNEPKPPEDVGGTEGASPSAK
jgi:hypothetical protein